MLKDSFTFENFTSQHAPQLLASEVPQNFWKTIHKKITEQTFDSGKIFSLIKIDYDSVEKEDSDPIYQVQIKVENVNHNDSQHIYLIDHAWTFRIEFARKQLLHIDNLRERMAGILGLECEDKEILVDKISNEMWKYVNTYSIGNATTVEDRMPVWYIMDEVGCGMVHSDTPNFRMVPFIYIPESMTYSLIFPIKNLTFADIVTRDFAEGFQGDERKALLLPWVPHSFIKESYQHVDPSPDYFLSGHIKETLPSLDLLESKPKTKPEKYKIYAEYEYVHKYLTCDRFEFVIDDTDADILWYTQHFKNFEDLSKYPHKFVNQFPFEYILTIKDLLAITCRRKSPKLTDNLIIPPIWLPVTFNLKTELIQFISYYQNREEKGFDNHWIIKPFNLARGLDTHITNNLNYIMRLPPTGPKIAQKYIENPVVFNREECGKVKFDIRYVLLLKSTKPLVAYAYKNFFLRFANQPFELKHFDQYEKHFTVMNYNESAVLKHMLCSEFKTRWEEQFPNFSWNDVEKKIFEMFREIFECATIEFPPCGISESPQSRALYAADLMLEWNKDEIQPKILEINWTPDCKRACEYYPEFYNDIFKLLFLDVENNDIFYKL